METQMEVVMELQVQVMVVKNRPLSETADKTIYGSPPDSS